MVEIHPKTATARELGKTRNRKLLLHAAAKSIHQHGLRGTTVDVIQRYSGLGRGMINQHFKSKENLLWSVAEQLMSEYRQNWRTCLEKGGTTYEGKLRALCQGEFSETVLTQQTVSIWLAFRSEASASVSYQRLVADGDAEFNEALYNLCRAICEERQLSDVDPRRVSRLMNAVFEGLWLEFHLNPQSFDRQAASDACFHMAQKLMAVTS
ncbi:TetR family transcriptional regulator C-terminal domain-containing protein [Ruegeria sp.]|uniref:TetR family transcriptional regulator C-terminal domain-containing protein n=1 Tax=Ruegeria sp. TaxID=1879320 RepID=UPI00231AF646|nr:TetR family transcriptional regulator C-terminal domain-containing protein [Ruegeria sp.]MDA7965154.1 TetR family transcriptional regulator C-terminal domain-containing protein [Ruegeria sp.]